ncbi:hypothetical protein CRG98_027210 [Punica granatum]|uniref:Nodulin-like domain-containing protein n=1 Tax=Punica granatum TaxID=22663 RepID=A0A2I0J843_PUNGR|nr:hypothetical protein CRG98_027210 [Punica granatum]
MLILFVATTCGVGGTLTAIDNLGQIGAALGYPARSVTTFVSLVSIWNYLGRAVAGFASEVLLVKYSCPRPLLFTLVLILLGPNVNMLDLIAPHSVLSQVPNPDSFLIFVFQWSDLLTGLLGIVASHVHSQDIRKEH